ncbi:glycosyl hydrolase [Paenibacillus marchantiophytorum]|uniref:Glycosyl hydrolase n=1 Tax=Paenibacillus marchantiophytorum TaxID=1619310 RepID=A0ABQ1EW73_9BACL|nr:glycoside hydrolase family 125 protein [Paenibacillus marchantiophytorum]GFZ88809.1 glycosyl hydrolase [Paenibacillus marchantiophytorum]
MTQTTRLPESMCNLIDFVNDELLKMERPKLAAMFRECFTNTYQTTVQREEDGSTFVITGDIPAMWLRDSSAQVRTYLLLADKDAEFADMIAGVIERQIAYIALDPYANAFNKGPNGAGHQQDHTQMNPWIWERKYEIDSLCYPIQLSYLHWKATGRTAQFSNEYRSVVLAILQLWKVEQEHEAQSPYRFQRSDCPSTDTLTRAGLGSPVRYTGMTWSGFRPSDDACTYGYLIPSNMFAVVVLGYIAEIAEHVWQDAEVQREALNLAAEINKGIATYGITEHPKFGSIYAYEADGFGNVHLMDDANVPSLLSIPYLGYAAESDPMYQRTRNFILSEENPCFYAGKEAQGVGSPHTPDSYIWPIALAVQGLTASAQEEKLRILDVLAATDGGTGLMHEGFHADDAGQFTRPWFSWANSMFSELVLDVCGLSLKKFL